MSDDQEEEKTMGSPKQRAMEPHQAAKKIGYEKQTSVQALSPSGKHISKEMEKR